MRTPSFDWSPVPGLELITFALPLVPYCDQCGEPLTGEGHDRCRDRARARAAALVRAVPAADGRAGRPDGLDGALRRARGADLVRLPAALLLVVLTACGGASGTRRRGSRPEVRHPGPARRQRVVRRPALGRRRPGRRRAGAGAAGGRPRARRARQRARARPRTSSTRCARSRAGHPPTTPWTRRWPRGPARSAAAEGAGERSPGLGDEAEAAQLDGEVVRAGARPPSPPRA